MRPSVFAFFVLDYVKEPFRIFQLSEERNAALRTISSFVSGFNTWHFSKGNSKSVTLLLFILLWVHLLGFSKLSSLRSAELMLKFGKSMVIPILDYCGPLEDWGNPAD